MWRSPRRPDLLGWNITDVDHYRNQTQAARPPKQMNTQLFRFLYPREMRACGPANIERSYRGKMVCDDNKEKRVRGELQKIKRQKRWINAQLFEETDSRKRALDSRRSTPSSRARIGPRESHRNQGLSTRFLCENRPNIRADLFDLFIIIFTHARASHVQSSPQ